MTSSPLPDRRHRDGRTSRLALLLPLVATMLLACGQRAMVHTSGQIQHYMLAGDYPAALTALRQGKTHGYREQDRVAYWMQEGMLLHLVGAYRESIAALERAEKCSDELFTKSVGKEITAAFTSQAATDYAGEDYEKVLLNVVKALDFMRLGDLEGALVEARKINERLQYFNTRYTHRNVYNQDAFAHWLAGMLYESDRAYDDARIAYEAALRVYREDFEQHYGLGPPGYLVEDLARVARLNGDHDLAAEYEQRYGAKGVTATLRATHGEVVLVHLNGQGPSKTDFFVTCWFFDAARWACNAEPGDEFVRQVRIDVPPHGTVVKIAFPQLHLHEPVNPYLTMQVGETSVQSQPAYPLNAIAGKTLRDRMHRDFRQTIMRAITKYLTQKAAETAGNQNSRNLGWLAKTAVGALMQATEEADKRAWTSLPARIDIARAMVRPGTYQVHLRLADGTTALIPEVTVVAGGRNFLTYRSLP